MVVEPAPAAVLVESVSVPESAPVEVMATVEAEPVVEELRPVVAELPLIIEEPPLAVAEEPQVVEELPLVVAEQPAVVEDLPPVIAAFAPVADLPEEEALPSLEDEPTIEAAEDVMASDLAPVLQITRTVRIEVPPRSAAVRVSGVERLLRLAVARAASALFVTADSRPSIRVEGDVRPLDGEPPMTRAEVEAAVMEIVPEAEQEAVGRGEPTEWITEFADLGRISIADVPGLLRVAAVHEPRAAHRAAMDAGLARLIALHAALGAS